MYAEIEIPRDLALRHIDGSLILTTTDPQLSTHITINVRQNRHRAPVTKRRRQALQHKYRGTQKNSCHQTLEFKPKLRSTALGKKPPAHQEKALGLKQFSLKHQAQTPQALGKNPSRTR